MTNEQRASACAYLDYLYNEKLTRINDEFRDASKNVRSYTDRLFDWIDQGNEENIMEHEESFCEFFKKLLKGQDDAEGRAAFRMREDECSTVVNLQVDLLDIPGMANCIKKWNDEVRMLAKKRKQRISDLRAEAARIRFFVNVTDGQDTVKAELERFAAANM